MKIESKLLALLAIVLAFVQTACVGSLGLIAAEATTHPPNVILIMADDVSWECFGSYGAEDYQTPRIDEMAARGLRFTHCYSQPLCTPSRVEIMTGKYNFRNYTHFGYLDPSERTIGHLMQDAGYATAIAGKWQLNGIYTNNPKSQDSKRPLEAGFDEALLWQVTKGKADKRGGERFWNPALEHNGVFLPKDQTEGKYGPDLFTDFICDFMDRKKKQPFFVYYPMALVHDPFVPTPETIGDRDKSKANKEPKDRAKKKENFVAMVNYMDRLVGRIIDHIDSLGLSNDTLIVFTADNGTHPKITSSWNGIEITGGKGGMTDMGTHVPMVALWKGTTPQGTVTNDLVDFTDVYPTLAELASVESSPNSRLDGRSFLPQLRGETGSPRSFALCHYHSYWGKPIGQFVRNQRFKLYGNGNAYDIAGDLSERNPLSETDSHWDPEQRREFQDVLDSLPPLPTDTGRTSTKKRLVYPNWEPPSNRTQVNPKSGRLTETR